MYIFLFLQSFICFFLGAIFGNVLTTFFFRVPRNIPINGIERPPMCSSCGIRLRYPYYGPFFQALFKGLKCSVCGAKIPIIYTFIELASGLFCLSYFLFFPIDSLHIVKFLSIIVFFLIFLLHYKTEKLYEKTNWIFLTISLINTFYIFAGQDVLQEIIIKIAIAMLPSIALKVIFKKPDILEICLLIALSLTLKPEIFLIGSTIFLILKYFKKNISLLPFILLLIL